MREPPPFIRLGGAWFALEAGIARFRVAILATRAQESFLAVIGSLASRPYRFDYLETVDGYHIFQAAEQPGADATLGKPVFQLTSPRPLVPSEISLGEQQATALGHRVQALDIVARLRGPLHSRPIREALSDASEIAGFLSGVAAAAPAPTAEV